jgi:hypothetical protein
MRGVEMSKGKSAWLMIVLAGLSATSVAISRSDQRNEPLESERVCLAALKGRMHMRTELLFGLSRHAGPDISEPEFKRFVDEQIVPRFPEGLTIVTGNGRFKDAHGNIVQETSKLLVVLYEFGPQRSEQIEEIRTAYRARFQQQSVLRIDEMQCVSF